MGTSSKNTTIIDPMVRPDLVSPKNEPSDVMTDCSIIIPAYNEATYLPQSLASAFAAGAAVPGTVEVLVVDNNSNDGTADIARSMGATVVHEPVNHISRARNAGAREARGRFFVFLDADTILTPALLGRALDNLTSGRISGGGTTVALDRPLDASAQSALDGWNRFSTRFHIAAGSFIYCEEKAFRAVGGFSEKVFASEEIWFSIRMHFWSFRREKRFRVIGDLPIVTSGRKLDWYSKGRLMVSSMIFILFPFALFSRRLCHLWYDRPDSPTKKSDSL